MSLSPLILSTVPLRFPRVSGDEPIKRISNGFELGFSPRERG